MIKNLYKNKKAFFDYDIQDKVECGIVLEGWEVKALKEGKFNFDSAFIVNQENELYVVNSRISPTRFSVEKSKNLQERKRKLLLRKNQIYSLTSKSKEAGYTLIPIEIYISQNRLIKISIAIAKGKKKYDKRLRLREKELKRKIQNERKQYGI